MKRRHLTSSQLGIIALGVEEHLMHEAQEKERKRKKATTFQNFGKSLQELPEKSIIQSTKQAASLLGTNHQYVSDAKRIAKDAPELLPHIVEGTLTIPDAKARVCANWLKTSRKPHQNLTSEQHITLHTLTDIDTGRPFLLRKLSTIACTHAILEKMVFRKGRHAGIRTRKYARYGAFGTRNHCTTSLLR